MTTSIFNKKDSDLAQRLLRPENLTQEFLGYMNDYLAINQPPIPLSNIIGVNSAMMPIGMPGPWLTGTIPYGFVLLDGTAVSRVTYALLFELWGIGFGAGDGSTTFNLPDIRGRLLVGKGTHARVDTIGETEGESTVGNRAGPIHSHSTSDITVNDSGHTHSNTAHSHTAPRATVAGGAADVFLPGNTASGTLTTNTSTITIATATTGITLSGTLGTSGTPSGGSYMVVNWITRYLTSATPQPVQELPQATS